MKNTIGLILVLIMIGLSCTQVDKTAHISYKELTKFLMTRELKNKFNIQNIAVDNFSLSDSIHHEAGHETDRKLKASYEFRLIGKQKEYLSKALITSNDSLNWQLILLIITEKSVAGRTKTEHAYRWDLTKSLPNQQSDLVTIVTEE